MRDQTKDFLRKALRTTVVYTVVLLLFGVFLYTFISIAGDNFTKWFSLYSILNFVILFFMLYSDYKNTAITERKSTYVHKAYPIKGLFMGLVGFAPIVAIYLALSAIRFRDQLASSLAQLIAEGIFGPVYFIVQAGEETTIAYATAALVVPAIAALGYLAGYYNFSLGKCLGKKQETVTRTDKTFEPSPWNPSVIDARKSKEKKNKR